QPPESVGKFWLERFSPYFKWPEKYGLRITGPGSAYEYVYDPKAVDLKRIAYDFEYEITSRVEPGVYEELVQLVHEWQRRHASADKPFLYYSKSMEYVTIYDGRATGAPSRQRYDWPEAFVIEYCSDTPKSLDQIRDGLKDQGHPAASDSPHLRQALADLVEKRLLYEERGKYFTLALPMNPNL
ncbi:MAG: RiPP maturation radical SAM C-methyltransferase, partial [Nitrospiraceae bacterium]